MKFIVDEAVRAKQAFQLNAPVMGCAPVQVQREYAVGSQQRPGSLNQPSQESQVLGQAAGPAVVVFGALAAIAALSAAEEGRVEVNQRGRAGGQGRRDFEGVAVLREL